MLPRTRGVHVDHAPVVLGDRLGRRGSIGLLVQIVLQRVPPDGAADGEPDVSRNTGSLAKPVDHGVLVGPAAEDHAGHTASPPRADLLGDPLAVLSLVDTFALPDVRLDPSVLQR